VLGLDKVVNKSDTGTINDTGTDMFTLDSIELMSLFNIKIQSQITCDKQSRVDLSWVGTVFARVK
jgi:hypothetical protein